jgi:hypothetical protein
MEEGRITWLRIHRRLALIACAVLAGAAVVVIFAPGLIAPWSRLNNEEQELDLLSGRARFTRYFFYCQISQEVRETPLSEALDSSDKNDGKEQWVKVNVFQPGVSNSPHFIYHGAFVQTGQLAKYWETGNFTPSARAKSARQLLKVWRDGGSYHAANPYFENLVELIVERNSDEPITVDEIPDDLGGRSLSATNPPSPFSDDTKALADAVNNNRPKDIRKLIAGGLNPNTVMLDGTTILHAACGMGKVECVRTLLDGGADVHIVDAKGRTPLHWVAEFGMRADAQRDIAILLLQAGADLNAKDAAGNTPLAVATHSGNSACAQVLQNQLSPASAPHE